MTTRILITGAAGFVGSRVAAAARATPGVSLRLMTHRTELDASAAGPGVETVHGDLADPGTLRGSCEGVDAVIHCASHIGSGEQTARIVNEHGTRALVDEAVRSGVGRIVQLSTASVYGRGPFRALLPGMAEPAPASATSLTRAAAEQHVLAAGGAVLRPHIVHGAGDRWAIPGLVALLRYLSAGPVGCDARHSMIDVGTLGRALLGAALSPKQPAGVYHVNHPQPVTCSELLSEVLTGLALPWARTEIGLDEARARLAGVPYAKHHFEMLTVDHWFADERVWGDFDCVPGPDFRTSFAEHAPWYRKFLSR
ncbi:NAD-dependent epimerase/dehydratase family protein [Streptomyces laculatispora]|uniref:NAD-dependent epimerase/dehydratase family protein n=1 Tax=Streptomyces laculatispora TaxID=887464 RepID=A0ABY9IAD8_9ACTN|nr:NAD-dependent epimerase/dehydratase family protein [Streptomyces laculatispora]WLQ43391.1 NAD-dependent epimerase/dehydratase family protein [Streptomyces laculatispora]